MPCFASACFISTSPSAVAGFAVAFFGAVAMVACAAAFSSDGLCSPSAFPAPAAAAALSSAGCRNCARWVGFFL